MYLQNWSATFSTNLVKHEIALFMPWSPSTTQTFCSLIMHKLTQMHDAGIFTYYCNTPGAPQPPVNTYKEPQKTGFSAEPKVLIWP